MSSIDWDPDALGPVDLVEMQVESDDSNEFSLPDSDNLADVLLALDEAIAPVSPLGEGSCVENIAGLSAAMQVANDILKELTSENLARFKNPSPTQIRDLVHHVKTLSHISFMAPAMMFALNDGGLTGSVIDAAVPALNAIEATLKFVQEHLDEETFQVLKTELEPQPPSWKE